MAAELGAATGTLSEQTCVETKGSLLPLNMNVLESSGRT
jgi:hypothetical protein